MDSHNADCRGYYEVVARNLDRARRRRAWEHAKEKAGSGVGIRGGKVAT